jgi:DNA polymerase-4
MCPRKIIHVDMDAFYAAVEMRDNPDLRDKPLAVGGDPSRRGVICTANYVARKYGVKSAVASASAVKLCPGLIILRPDMEKYKRESRRIHEVFARFTGKIESVGLDEAYLDVSDVTDFDGSGTLIAKEIKRLVHETTALTASAGIASNKFLAKVASDYKKPDGLFCISPRMADEFVKTLEVKRIPGVGKVTAQKLAAIKVKTCGDLQSVHKETLVRNFGKFGAALYDLCRGNDDREVEVGWERKSLSIETTFDADINGEECVGRLPDLHENFMRRLARYQDKGKRPIHSIHAKIKFKDFSATTIERGGDGTGIEQFLPLLKDGLGRKDLPVRLIGIGVKFAVTKPRVQKANPLQLSFGF